MTIWGLHIIDLIIVILFLFVLLWIGKKVSKHNKDSDDFFLAGRKLNKIYQFFLNFGCSTNADQAVAVTREIYRQGIADHVGQSIEKNHTIAPVGIYFESVAKINPNDPSSPKVGIGRFQAEVWIMSWFGIDFTSWTKPRLTAARFFFDAFFPFILLFLISFVTRPEEKIHLDKFYAKMYTPVQPTPQEEKKALQYAYENPGMYENRKLFKKSNWEMLKPKKIDYIGFFGSWGLVGIIIFLLWLVVNIGK